jgi:DNA-binding IclR family transcriptional regulator
MKVSISRSVGRAFAVMELFRQTRRPASATQLSRLLDAPHSSVVAVLHNLRDLGYLSFDRTDMTYFPTAKLFDLAAWKRPAPHGHGRLVALLDSVARDTSHLTVLSSRLSLFVNTVAVRPGRFTAVAQPLRSVGAALAASVAGLAILAQLDDPEVHEIVRETEIWLRDTGARKTFDTASIFSAIEAVRRRGILSAPHPTCRGTEIIACPVKLAQGTPFSIAVHIPSCLSRESRHEVEQLLQTRMQESAAGATLPHATHVQAAPGFRRPQAPQAFVARLATGGHETMSQPLLAAHRDAG